MINQSTLTNNAADGLLAIKAQGSGRFTLKVLSENGMVAKSVNTSIMAGANELILDVDDLGKGKYVVNAFNDGRFVQSVRFVRM